MSNFIHLPWSEYYTSLSCQYTGKTLQMFAFRVHAHTHGDVNTAYRVRNNQWTQIAKGDPQLPQAFYPTTESTFDIQNGDILMAICTYHNNETREIRQGSTHNDEMCNVYIMYYTENAENVQDSCGGHKYLELEQQIPADARVKPVQMGGSTEKLEPVPQHTMHHEQALVMQYINDSLQINMHRLKDIN